MKVAGIMLAAGFSRRLGRPKQTVEIGGETLIRRATRIASEAGLEPIVVVVNRHAEFADDIRQPGRVVVMNSEAEEGIASSIRAGVLAVLDEADVHGVVLMTCDQIGITAPHLQALFTDQDRVTGSAYASKVAVPAYFPRRCFEDLLALRGDTGARDLLRNAFRIQAEALALDIDTEDDLSRAKGRPDLLSCGCAPR